MQHIPGIEYIEQTTNPNQAIGIHQRTGQQVVCSMHSTQNSAAAAHNAAQVMCAIHPNLVPLVEAIPQQHALIVVHEHTPTTTPPASADPAKCGWAWCTQAFGALGALHAQGAVHGNICATNLRLTAGNELMLHGAGTPTTQPINPDDEVHQLCTALSQLLPAACDAGRWLRDEATTQTHNGAVALARLAASRGAGKTPTSAPPPSTQTASGPRAVTVDDPWVNAIDTVEAPPQAPTPLQAPPIPGAVPGGSFERTWAAEIPAPQSPTAFQNRRDGTHTPGWVWLIATAVVVLGTSSFAAWKVFQPGPSAPEQTVTSPTSAPSPVAPTLTAPQLTTLSALDAEPALRTLLMIRNQGYVDASKDTLALALAPNSLAAGIEAKVFERDRGAKHPGLELVIDTLIPVSVEPTQATFDVTWHNTAHESVRGETREPKPETKPALTRIAIGFSQGRWWITDYVNADTGP